MSHGVSGVVGKLFSRSAAGSTVMAAGGSFLGSGRRSLSEGFYGLLNLDLGRGSTRPCLQMGAVTG